MVFPTANIEVSPWLPPLVAFVISFFTSMGGVSGAFLLLPFQISVLGFSSPAVSATNQLFNIVAIPSGVYRYIREGRMVWPLTWVVIIGTLPGVLIGAIVRVRYLPNPKNFTLFAGLVLLYIGIRIVRDLLKKKAGAGKNISAEEEFQALVQRYRQAHATGQTTEQQAERTQPKKRGRRFQWRVVEYEIAVTVNQEFHRILLALAALDDVVDLGAQILRQIGIRISQGLVLADEAPQLLDQIFVSLLFRGFVELADFHGLDA